MKESNDVSKDLLERYISGECTEDEKIFVDAWYLSYKKLSPPLDIQENQIEGDLSTVWNNVDLFIKNNRRKTISWKKWIAVAASLFIVGISSYYLWNRPTKESFSNEVYVTSSQSKKNATKYTTKAVKADVSPAESGAILVLSNGEKIYLNNQLQTGDRTDHNVHIDFSNQEQVVYKESTTAMRTNEKKTNTLIVPKGNVYNIILADGTKVSLNADSKLTFPIQFDGDKREVYLEGEGYFEVSKQKIDLGDGGTKQKFIVHVGKSSVQVLGTKFNIKAYREDTETSFTLEEGSIALSTPKNVTPLILHPGQKATQTDKEVHVENVSLESILSWKKGDFYFENITVKEIMSQLSRWYNVDVFYTGPIDDQRYISTISRKKTLKEVLQILETTTGIKFDIQEHGKERRIMVMP